MTRKEKISAFFKQSELFDYMVTRPLSHIVPNWELTWNLKENRVEPEEDSLAEEVNRLLDEISEVQPPKEYHANEDVLAEYVKSHLNWNIYKKGKRWESSDYEAIINGDFTNLEKYKISKPYTSTFDKFISKIKDDKTLSFVKGQIVGPFSFSTSLTDANNVSVFYDDTLRDIAIKTLTLKALWQIEQIKNANKNITPVIFMDEPSLSHIGTCAFLTIDINMVKNILNDMSNILKSFGAITTIHCCGKMLWDMLTTIDVDILNFDAYSYSDNIELYSNYISNFLDKGGIIAWGIVPTLDVNELEIINYDILDKKFHNILFKLEQKGINKDKIIKQSIFTPSCGCGGLSKELALKACKLTSQFAENIKEKYKEKVF